jgi:hypothetical protein
VVATRVVHGFHAAGQRRELFRRQRIPHQAGVGLAFGQHRGRRAILAVTVDAKQGALRDGELRERSPEGQRGRPAETGRARTAVARCDFPHRVPAFELAATGDQHVVAREMQRHDRPGQAWSRRAVQRLKCGHGRVRIVPVEAVVALAGGGLLPPSGRPQQPRLGGLERLGHLPLVARDALVEDGLGHAGHGQQTGHRQQDQDHHERHPVRPYTHPVHPCPSLYSDW